MKAPDMSKWKRKRILYFMLIYLLPFRDFPLILREPVSVRLFDIAVFASLFGYFLSLMHKDKTLKLNINVLLVFFFYMSWMCIVSLLGLHHHGSQSLILRYLLLVPFSFVIYFLAYDGSFEIELSWFIRHVIMSLVIGSSISYLISYANPDWVKTWAGGIHLEDKGFKTTRFTGFASEPNYWGNLFLFILPVAFIGIFSKSARNELRVNRATLLMLITFVVLTFSTFTHVSTLLAFTCVLLLNFKGVNKRSMLYFSVIMLAVIGLISYQYLGYVSAKVTTLTTSSSFERFYWAYSAFNMWLEAPLIGHGSGTYIFNFQNYLSFITIPLAEQANSVFFATLAEQGVIGLVFLSFSMASLGGLLSPRLVLSMKENIFLKALAIGIVLYIPYFFITGTLYLYYFWFYLGAFRGFSEKMAMWHETSVHHNHNMLL